MENTIFLIDDLGRIEAVLERAYAGSGIKIESFHDPVAAKRKLLEKTPALIIALHTFQNHPDGGFRLARELSEHEQLALIPLVIVSDQLSEEIIHQATESGAKTLIPWPVTIDSLRNRLKPFLGGLLPPEDDAAVTRDDAPSTNVMSPAPAAEIEESFTPDQKIQLAQQLLAKVLHNLKTSALLDVIDLEDVPQVVLEIMRGICGGNVPEKKTPTKPQSAPAAPVPESAKVQQEKALVPAVKPQPAQTPKSEITADLDRVFGLKK